MGTNYYVEDDSEKCEKCGRGGKELHLGKSSGGWCFSLHVYPEDGINTLDDLIKLIGDNQIKDEYGDDVSKKLFLEIVTKRGRNRNFEDKPFGYKSWKSFHKLNYSEFGPNGLLRHQINGHHCIGHGEGTWDYIVGYFS